MNLLTAITELISIFLFTTLFILSRGKWQKIGLVDKPNYRKRHQVDSVGRWYLSLCRYLFHFRHRRLLYSSRLAVSGLRGVLVLVGALDDRFDISVKIRAVIQAAIAVIMMMAGICI